MRFYNNPHTHSCGVDLHAKTMYLCILGPEDQVLLHENIRSEPAAFLRAIEPYRGDLVVAAECTFTWYWLADLCQREGIDFVLGHALYMKAIHGAKAKNDKLDAFKIAKLLRAGMLPEAYAYPQKMRATRDLLRRRLHLVRKRGELLAHIQNTHHQANLPVPAAKVAYAANRLGVAERFTERDTRKSVELDFALIAHYDTLIKDLELHLVRQAKQHDPGVFHRLRSVPGIGKILALTILYEVHDIARFPRVQDFVSYARLVRCEHSSAGKKLGGPEEARSATPTSSGPSRRRRCSSCEATPVASSSSVASRGSTARARRSPSSPQGSGERSTSCFAARRASTANASSPLRPD